MELGGVYKMRSFKKLMILRPYHSVMSFLERDFSKKLTIPAWRHYGMKSF